MTRYRVRSHDLEIAPARISKEQSREHRGSVSIEIEAGREEMCINRGERDGERDGNREIEETETVQ